MTLVLVWIKVCMLLAGGIRYVSRGMVDNVEGKKILYFFFFSWIFCFSEISTHPLPLIQ